jgi:hypothetical protein
MADRENDGCDREGDGMEGAVDRFLAIERALDDVRFAHRLLTGRVDVDGWRGPARTAFDAARSELPSLLRSAEAALERERGRALLLLAAGG